jgi:hypothetical protein
MARAPFAGGAGETVVPAASDAIHLLIEYQGTACAKLYVERLPLRGQARHRRGNAA